MKSKNKITGRFEKNLPKLSKKCEICGKEFSCRSIFKFNTGRFCSKECLGIFNSRNNKGKTPYKITNEIKEKISKAKEGSPSCLKGKDAIWAKGENNFNWKENPSYRTIHQWVEKWKGKADHCEMCGDNDQTHRYHWANVDHNYKRVLEDYIQLCPKCHGKYDAENNLRAKKA